MNENILSPKEIKEYLDIYVVGQEEAKKTLANAAYMHEARELVALKLGRKEPFKKTTCLLIGPTGVGKTYLIQKLAQVVDRQVFTINAKDITSEGYVGMGISDYLDSFSNNYQNIKELEKAIIFIDEFDKLCTGDGPRNSFNIPIQQQLLKVIEGIKKEVGSRSKKNEIDTSHIMFILGGSFQHMRDARKKDKPKNPMGFMEEEVKKPKKIPLHKELQNNGVIRELAGRISVVTELHELQLKHLKKIATIEDGIIDQYKVVLDELGIKHGLTTRKINKIARECIALGTGARGLQTQLEEHLRDIIFKSAGSIDEKKFLEGIGVTKGKQVVPLQQQGSSVTYTLNDYMEDMEDLDLGFDVLFFGGNESGAKAFKEGDYWRTRDGKVVLIYEISEAYGYIKGIIKEPNARDEVLSWKLNGIYPEVPDLDLMTKINTGI